MPVSPDLTGALKKVVLSFEDDLRARVASQPEVDTAWRGLHAQAVDRERTAMSWQAWRDDRVTQAAVAWVLTSVFVRFCEDNRLLRPVWIAGPGERRQEALDAELQYFRHNPEHTDREWLLRSVEHLAALRATRDLVGSHSPLWTVSPSGQAVKSLLTFWRETRDDGSLVWDFTDPDLSTRFLGDLYQDLSDYAKKTFALLQTPEFVEEFILDQTMEPALAERPLEGFRMIDPTCGSGHFLLGAFARLNDRWAAHAPGLEPRARVQKALDAVHGVDLNPFAVAIARFRLMVAALQACGELSLEDAPGFILHLVAGDSLLHGGHQLELGFEGFDAASQLSGFAYDTEDLQALRTILAPGRYDVVVGNPPYILPPDPRLNSAYRLLYATCHRKYQLTVPFIERFLQLAKGPTGRDLPGWTGQITSNAFMKREFGKKLIEDFLPHADLRYVIDSEGAWIPGHNTDGTPTVILVATNQAPTSGVVRTVMSKGKRETRASGALGLGPYWQGMLQGLMQPGYEDDFVQVLDLGRATFSSHPWSLSGGGAVDLLAKLDSLEPLSSRVDEIGFSDITGDDDAFLLPISGVWKEPLTEHAPPFVEGEHVRDYTCSPAVLAILPTHWSGTARDLSPAEAKRLWTVRTGLRNRIYFGKSPEQRGLRWYDHAIFQHKKHSNAYLISFAFIATHNHFALDRGGRLFNKSAPVIKLPASANETDHLRLLAALNSSTACFWMKEKSQPKGGAADIGFLRTFEFTGTTLLDLPVPHHVSSKLSRKIDTLSQELTSQCPAAVVNETLPTAQRLMEAEARVVSTRRTLVALQEELDWEMYYAYGLIGEPLTYRELPPGIALGQRAFEISLARQAADEGEVTAWFSHHGIPPLTDIPSCWPTDYAELVQRRLNAIDTNEQVRLLEKPEYKRRWAAEPWEKQVERALRGWLLDRLEDRRFWFDDSGRPIVRSVGQLADEVSRDADLVSVLELWSGRKDQSVTTSLTTLLDTESVPFLAAYRLKDSGLRKREAWEHTWDLQRREDAGETVGDIPVPPKYTSADFRKTSWWQHRGKLDVPKERFILYPDAARETDPTPVLGWAGWDHAQQALALASLIQERETEGWDDERLIPLIAGLGELQPWVRQWHDETDPSFGVNLADYLEEQLRSRASQIARTLDELHAWRPEPSTRGRKPRA